MKKFINQPENFVDEMLMGILAAHPDKLDHVNDDLHCIVKKDTSKDKVAIATGGGSGHLPLFLGYVGDGLLDGCAVGGVFQSPTAEQMFEITKKIDAGKGVLYIYGNYTGDILNFDMAAEMADMEGIKVRTILGADDVASAPKTESQKRRGVAGIFYLYKVAGAMAELGASLDEVVRVTEKVAANVGTMGVALSPCIIPEVGKPTFNLAEDEMEIGMGIHGEPGIRRGTLRPADAVVDEMLLPVLEDLQVKEGQEVSILVNGLGATCKEELYIVFRRVAEILKERQISLFSTYVGEFATSMEMAGLSISVCVIDEEIKSLLKKRADTPFFTQIGS